MTPSDENTSIDPDQGARPGGHAAWRTVAAAARQTLDRERVRMLLDYWLSIGTDGRPPGRANLDPAGMVPLLSHIWLMDYEAGPRRLRYRLVGEEIRSRYGVPLVGRYLDEVVDPDGYPKVARYFLDCAGLPAIAVLSGRLYSERMKPGYGERLLLPLFSADGAPEGLIGTTICDEPVDSETEAALGVGRRITIFPLDGSAPTTEEA